MSANQNIDGRFFFNDRIGKGGMGEVWRGTQEPLGRPVAIKILRRELSADGSLRRRFAREARAASALNHQNIVSLYDFGVDDTGLLYIAMELADGPSLASIIDQGIVLSTAQILELADQLLAGLAHAHARGVVHRDLKPDNVVFAQQSLPGTLGVAKLCDFGIASVAGQSSDIDDADSELDGKTALGTPRYMSPEQALGGRNLSPRTDLYNVGLILWELVAGRPPFGELDGMEVMESHVYEAPPGLRDFARIELPETFFGVIDRALAKRPLERWASAGEMRDALAPAMRQALRVDWRPRTSPRVTYRPTPNLEDDLPVLPRLPLIGRMQERRLIENLVERAVEKLRGSVVLIEGAAGVGKSRLVGWSREFVEESGAMRANVGSFTRGDRSNMRGIQEVFETVFRTRGFHRSEVTARVGARLKEWGYDSADDRDAVVDFLRPRSDMPTRPHETTRLFATLSRVLSVVAEPQPRLIVLEDLHWAGQETFDFLDYLAVEFRHRELPIVVVATYRPEEIASRSQLASRLAGLSRYVGETVERVELDRLDLQTARQLVESVLPVTSDVADVVIERSGGVPLHIITLIQYLKEESLLELANRMWRPKNLAAVRQAMPPDLAQLFARRFEQAETRHGLPLRNVAMGAAIAGMKFDFRVVEAIAVGQGVEPSTFDDTFDALLQDEFIVADERGGDVYTFSHALLRDWLLAESRADAWTTLHELAARAKEKTVGARVAEHGLDIAWHWREAGDWLRAVDWYEKTARFARPSYAPRQAAKALRAAVRLVDEHLGIDTDDVHPFNAAIPHDRFDSTGISRLRLLNMLTMLGDLYDGFGEYDAAERTFRRVVVQVGAPKDVTDSAVRAALAHAWLGIAHISRQRGDLDAAWWAFERVLELSDDLDDESVFERAARGLARLAWLKSDYAQAQRWVEAARESAKVRGDLDSEAIALWLMGDVARVQGDHDAAAGHYERSLALHHETDHKVGIARNVLSLAQLARHRNELESAQQLYERGLKLWRVLGNRRGEGLALNGLGDVARFQKRFGDASRYYAEAVEIFTSIGANYDLAVATANLGINALSVGRLESAEASLDQARRLIGDQDYPYLEAGIDFHRALLMEHRERGDEPADAPVPELDYAYPLEQMAELRAERGATEEANALLRRARDIYARLQLAGEVERLDEVLGAR